MCGARDDVQVLYVTGIKAQALHNKITAIYIDRAQLAVMQLRLTGREGHPGNIDKTTPVTGDAVGVSENIIGRLTGDFRVSQ